MQPELRERPPEIQRDLSAQAHNQMSGHVSTYSCPACGGTLWELGEGGLVWFNCHVGHAWAPESLLVEKSEELETALWSAVRALTEKATLTRQLADRARRLGDADRAARIEEQAALDEQHLRIIREQLLEAVPNPTTQSILVTQELEAAADGLYEPGDLGPGAVLPPRRP